MKKAFTFAALCALTLCACGGGNTSQTQDNSTQQSSDTLTVSTTETPVQKSENGVDVTKIVFNKLFPEIKNCYIESGYSCSGSYELDEEGSEAGASVYCVPFSDEGYFVLSESYFAGPGCSPDYEYGSWIYKNGSLDTTQNILPMPKFDDLINPNKAANYQAQATSFRDMYNHNPILHIKYSFISQDSMVVALFPYDCDEVFYEADKYMLAHHNNDQNPIYKWNGKKFELAVQGRPSQQESTNDEEE